MKIHYDKDITKSYHVTELHCTNTIELDGVKLIPITELEQLKADISQIDKIYYPDLSFNEMGDCYIKRKSVADVIDKCIAELKGENK